MNLPDPQKLLVLLEAARSGSYTVAAERLHVTQSAVSHAIRKLESDLGYRVVEWHQRRLTLTGEGAYLVQACERAFQELEDARDHLARGGATSQHVNIGANIEFGGAVLVQKLRPFFEAHPSWTCSFHLLPDLRDPLLGGDIDLAVDCQTHRDPSVEVTPLFREKYVVVATPAFAAAHRLRTPADLGRVPVISLDAGGSWWRNLLGALPAAGRPALGTVVAITQIRAMVHAAIEGYGVALLPKYTVLRELEQGTLRALFPRLSLLEDTFCVYQKRSKSAREKNRAVTAFLQRMDVREFGDAIRGSRSTSTAGRA